MDFISVPVRFRPSVQKQYEKKQLPKGTNFVSLTGKITFHIVDCLLFATSNVYFIPLVKDISKEIGKTYTFHYKC